ncbi:hypothetical protein DPMN_163340 [Dreissena polymorpha]|uniref:Uncharacterized protein n=1 Tax=Dreissena polymorpha TaxID=45954 RepID=A0A9D4ISQ6_DREPO|nr:hypothetical protein DPMN_163340 [Dreissena polymorpha]
MFVLTLTNAFSICMILVVIGDGVSIPSGALDMQVGGKADQQTYMQVNRQADGRAYRHIDTQTYGNTDK